MHPLTTVRIFLSSPGDVAAERAQVRELLLGLARGPFVRGRVHIDVVSWDDPHGGATMDARLTPQQAVDRSLPMPAECDLTVVLLWGRMGTPQTEKRADGSQYLSGTEWEFENALAANKPVFVYRRTGSVPLDPADPDFEERVTQIKRVNAFFGRFKGEGGALVRGHATYNSASDLIERLRQDVERYLSELLHEGDGHGASATKHGAARSSPIAAGPPEVPVAYREWVKKQYGGVDLLGLQLKKGRPPSLSAIYVPQTTIAAEPAEARQSGDSRRSSKYEVDDTGHKRRRHTLALSRLATESLYVSGAPGTGKSTFCRWVAWLVADGTVPALEVPPPEQFVEVLGEGLKGRLPVLLRLREFWDCLLPHVGGRLTATDLEDAMAGWVERRRPDGLDAALFRAHLAHGSALLLLDGMDEVPVSVTSAAGKWLPRQQLLSALADACPTWDRAGNRLLLTSRPYGVSPEQANQTTVGLAPLEPLPYDLQGLLAHRWFAVLSGDVEAGAKTASDLFANIGLHPWLVELASNPLLLTAMCIVFDEGKRLPHDKHELYERVVGTVLYSRYQDPADIDRAKRELGVIAYGMHTSHERKTPRAEATFHEIERWLQDYQDRKRYTERSEVDVFGSREALLSQSGLLVGSGEQRAAFVHLSFQEFFAAQRTFTVQEDRLADVFLERAATPEWRHTLSFLFGRLLAASSEPDKALALLQERIDRIATSDTGLLIVLADAAKVLIGKGISLPSDRLGRLNELLLTVMTGRADFGTRVDAGDALGWLGDPRFREDRLWLPDEDLLGFIRVESGAFLMGSDVDKDPTSRDYERPQHSVELTEYYVARYPVTVAQFRVFAADNRLEVHEPLCLRGVPNHPVTFVSFDEALAYCEWLTDRLRSAEWTPSVLRKQLASGWAITLPSEAQWEKAARGLDGRIYPWGNDGSEAVDRFAFSADAVGTFPDEASPCGALDLLSRTEVWTCSLWGQNPDVPDYTYPYDPNDAERHDVHAPLDVLRVVRGGRQMKFLPDPHLRGVARRGAGISDDVGFRLILSGPPLVA